MIEYIKREDALKNFFCVEVAEYESECVVTLDDIRAIPAADVDPVVRGEWTDGKCTNCGCYGYPTHDGGNERTPFCPFCGANMMERSGSGE